MKVTVALDGEVSFDTDDISQAVDMVKALRNGAAPAKSPAKPKKRGPYKKKAELVETEELSKELGDTWNWLVANSTPDGVKVRQVAEGLGCTVHAATFRLNRLISKGLAHRIKRGWYRPGEGPQQPVPMPQVVIAEDPAPPSEVAADSPE